MNQKRKQYKIFLDEIRVKLVKAKISMMVAFVEY